MTRIHIELSPPVLESSHLQTMVRWLNDPQVTKYSEQRHMVHTVETQLNYLYSFNDTDIIREIHADTSFIGTITAHIDEHNSIADVGILLGEKEQWGKGYGTQAWTLFCNWLFMEKGIRKIEAGCMACNGGMITVFRRYGMMKEGSRQQHFILDKEPIDMEYWGKLGHESGY